VKRAPCLFLDASVWIAAAGSKTGGSSLVLELGRQGQVKIVCSRHVLLEAERNIRKKLGREALLCFYKDTASTSLELVETPHPDEIAAQEQVIDRKDAHVLAAAVKEEVEFLLTLDRKHFMSPKVRRAGLPFQIMTSGDFLRYWLQGKYR